MEPKLWIEVAKIALTVAAALWVYFRFVRERSHARRVTFTIECRFFGPQDGKYVAEFVLRMKNQGLVIHRFKRLRLRVRGIEKDHPLAPWSKQPSRVGFPEKLVDEQDVLFSTNYGHIFVEPGVEQEVTFVAAIPETIGIILARAEFEYPDEKERTHSIERVFVPAAPNRGAA